MAQVAASLAIGQRRSRRLSALRRRLWRYEAVWLACFLCDRPCRIAPTGSGTLVVLDPAQIPSVAGIEVVARYVVFSKWVRSSDGTVKPDAFIPHPFPDLSVTRHLSATEQEVWSVGRIVA